jgi:hypothetical protein
LIAVPTANKAARYSFTAGESMRERAFLPASAAVDLGIKCRLTSICPVAIAIAKAGLVAAKTVLTGLARTRFVAFPAIGQRIDRPFATGVDLAVAISVILFAPANRASGLAASNRGNIGELTTIVGAPSATDNRIEAFLATVFI